MTEGFDLTEYLLRELGPMGSMLGLGFYWLRNQLDRLTNAITAIDSLTTEVEYTQACVSMIAEVQGIALPNRKKE